MKLAVVLLKAMSDAGMYTAVAAVDWTNRFRWRAAAGRWWKKWGLRTAVVTEAEAMNEAGLDATMRLGVGRWDCGTPAGARHGS